mgnify:CR=1 FL=1
MPRHVFLASVGLVLPVVTESLWALMNPPRQARGRRPERPPVAPGRVHIVTTAPFDPAHGHAEFERRRALLGARVAELYRQYGCRAPEFKFEAVEDPEAADGRRFIADVRTERENILYANHITRCVRTYCSDPDTVLHLSLAGGRKTMSSYDHSAMMFFGRVGDDMSHVLVEPQILERAGEQFWWPDQPERIVQVRVSRDEVEPVATTSEAVTVDLVPVPFIRLGVRLPAGIPPEAEDYHDLIAFIEFERDNGVFVVDADTLTVSFANRHVKLTRTYFALFAVFAIARKMGWPGAGSSEEGVGPNTAGCFFLNELRAGLIGDARNPVAHDTRALRCLRALLNDDRFQHGTEGTRLLEQIAQSRLDSRGRVVRDGRTVDATATYRSNLARQLKKGVRSPYTLRYLTPESWETEDGRIVVGLNVPPDRIVLKGFDPFQLVEG